MHLNLVKKSLIKKLVNVNMTNKNTYVYLWIQNWI
jgi:hypothetical protein